MARTRDRVTEDLGEVEVVVHAQAAGHVPTLEEAALRMLESLPKYCADTIRETAYVHLHRPVWTCLLGYALRAYEDGTLFTPLSDPSWPSSFKDLPDVLVETPCEECAIPFKPARYKQRFCSNACGTRHNAREANAAQPASA